MTLRTKEICKDMEGKFVFSIQGQKKKITYKHLKVLLDGFFTRVIDNVCNGETVVIMGFGTFKRKFTTYKKVYNFQDNTVLHDHPVSRICFKAADSTKLRLKINRSKLETPKAIDHHEKPQQL